MVRAISVPLITSRLLLPLLCLGQCMSDNIFEKFNLNWLSYHSPPNTVFPREWIELLLHWITQTSLSISTNVHRGIINNHVHYLGRFVWSFPWKLPPCNLGIELEPVMTQRSFLISSGRVQGGAPYGQLAADQRSAAATKHTPSYVVHCRLNTFVIGTHVPLYCMHLN